MTSRRPWASAQRVLAQAFLLLSCTGLLASLPACSRQPKQYAVGQPIPIDTYTLSVISVEMSDQGSQPLLTVFLRWKGVNRASESDKIHFVGMCLFRRFTLLDSKGKKFDYLDPMPEVTYRAKQASNGMSERGRLGGRASKGEYENAQKWQELARANLGDLAESLPEDWAVAFKISPESKHFTLFIGRSSYPFETPFGEQAVAVPLGR